MKQDDQPALQVTNLTKVFPKRGKPDFVAVNKVSFSIKKGEIVGLLGPNGAGKTTTIQMLLGLLTPSSGSISYFGLPFPENRENILARINSASAYAKFPWRLTVWENLDVMGYLYGIKDHRNQIDIVARDFHAEKLLHKKFQDLSAGQMTRVMLMKAFLNTPELILLDEPTASLDPDIASQVRKYILNAQQQRHMTMLITSHNMKEVEELCDRVIFLHQGKIIATGTPLELARKSTLCVLQLMMERGKSKLLSLLKQYSYEVSFEGNTISITLPEQSVSSLLRQMSQLDIEFVEIEINKPSLEDYFLSVSQQEGI